MGGERGLGHVLLVEVDHVGGTVGEAGDGVGCEREAGWGQGEGGGVVRSDHYRYTVLMGYSSLFIPDIYNTKNGRTRI